MKMIPHKKLTRKTGFTLVELLVAITILSIILLALGAAMGFVSRLWVNGVGTVDNFTKARVILNLLDRDIQMMVMRPDVAAFVDANGNGACAFYTNVQGNPGTDKRTVSLVQYAPVNPTTGLTDNTSLTLGRLNYGMNFLASGTSGAATPQIIASVVAPTPTPTPVLKDLDNVTSENLAGGVLLFQWQFIDGTGAILTPTGQNKTYTPTGLSTSVPFYYDYTAPNATYNPRVVVISIMVISNSAYTLATQTNKLAYLTEYFPQASLPANETYSQYWNSVLNNPPAGLSSLQSQIRNGIRVFERHIPLPIATASSS